MTADASALVDVVVDSVVWVVMGKAVSASDLWEWRFDGDYCAYCSGWPFGAADYDGGFGAASVMLGGAGGG